MRTTFTYLILLLLAQTSFVQSSIIVNNLRCEYMKNPLGVDIQQPRFSWELTSSGKNKKQSARQILVATEPALLAEGKADVWESGKTDCDRTNQVVYQGKPLKPFTVYYWKVAVWDEQGKRSAWSATAKFSTGAFSADDWKAQWIGDDDNVYVPETKYVWKGYFSNAQRTPFGLKWLIVDLEKSQPVDAVKIYPAQGDEYRFPLHFKVEISDNPDFAASRVIAGETANTDNFDKKILPYVKTLTEPVNGRYVRMTVTKMAATKENTSMIFAPETYDYGLAEIEILYRGQNLALKKPVTASEYTPDNPALLTDGYLTWAGGGNYSIPPLPLLRKEIRIDKKIKNALYHVSALGLYEAYINGKKVGRQVLAPEFTDYDHHVQYQTYDVGAMLQQGANALGAMLADGWYAGERSWHPARGGYGGFARKFIAQLEIYYEDGTSETIVTDGSWKYLARGPLTKVTLFGGEEYEAKNEQRGWENAGFDDSKWTSPEVSPVTSLPARAAGKYVLCAQMNEPMEVIEEIKPVSFHKVGDNKYIFDMGQNMVGWCRLSLPYNPSCEIRIRHAEMLNDDKTLYTANLRSATQTDVYHPSDEKRIEYEPRFTFHGFRYVEVDGLTQMPSLSNITGKVVASSSPKAGTLTTSDWRLNKLWENIRWTQWGNMTSIPTDCPQRNEREGWTGDAQIFSQTAIYNLDMAGFYTKWARDIRDDQLPDGRFPNVSPNDGMFSYGNYNSPGYADAGTIIPWKIYLNYGDTVILSKQFDCMKRYIDFIHINNPDLLWLSQRGNIYCDWLNGDAIIEDGYPKSGGRIPNDVFSTAYFAHSTEILARSAKRLGLQSDYEYYSALAANIRSAFVNKFVTDDGKIEGDTQAGYALALEFNLLPENLRAKAAANMVEAIKVYDGRISTGTQTTIRLMNQLCEYGYSDVAHQLLTSRRFPSWFYSIDQGATTIWERWDGYVAGRGFQNPGMNSFNHVALGAVGEWLYSHLLGIQYDESNPGYSHFYIKPQPGSLEHAKGNYHSISGNIEVEWTNRNGKFSLNVMVPVNTEATIVLPDGKTHRVGSGKYFF